MRQTLCISFLTLLFLSRSRPARRVVKRNPLKNPDALRRLNPYASLLKKFARAENKRRKGAKDVFRRKRAGQKISEVDLKKAAAVLGLKVKKYKEVKAERAKRAALRKAAATSGKK